MAVWMEGSLWISAVTRLGASGAGGHGHDDELGREHDPEATPQTFCEAMGHHPMAAFTAIHADPITRELPPPALQGAQPDAQKARQGLGPGTSGQTCFQDLQGLLAILWGGQSSPPSPP